MRKLFSVLAFFMFSVMAFSQEVQDFLGITELTFNEKKFVLATANQKSKIQYVQEYVAEDERLEDASAVITLYFFAKEIDAKEATLHKTEELDNRTKTDKFCTYNVTENPNGTEFVVDFMTSNVPKSKDEATPEEETAEYNIYRFRNVLLNENSAFMIVAYKEKNVGDTKAFDKSVGKKRNKLLEGMVTLTVPNVTLKTN